VTSVEQFGKFVLTIERDDRWRVISASIDGMTLSCEPDVPSGKLRSSMGSERWADGRVTGTWLDLPYGHECDVDKIMEYADWVDDCLRLLRSNVFHCEPRGKVALEVMRYAVEHKLLERHVSNSAAQETLKKALRLADDDEKRKWRRWFVRDKLDDYLKILG
jgi:hypothetical protein